MTQMSEEGIDVAEGDGEEISGKRARDANDARAADPDVFISYASPDSGVANSIADHARAAPASVLACAAERQARRTVYAEAIVRAINEG